jgi:hypothetical protein
MHNGPDTPNFTEVGYLKRLSEKVPRFNTARFFFLWCVLKGKIYMCNPPTIDDLKENFYQEIAPIL